jgi:hypothetical protein
MTDPSQLPAKKSSEPSRRWPAIPSVPASRSEMVPDDPDRLAAERNARRGLHPPQVTIRRVG